MSKYYARVEDVENQKKYPSTFINFPSKYYTIGKKKELVITQEEVVK